MGTHPQTQPGPARELVSIVVPTYGGAQSLEALVERLRAVMRARGQPHEVIVVNDASPDDAWERLLALVPNYDELLAIDLLRNHGQMAATMCGMAHARGAIVVTMDDDLQQPPEELPKLLDALEQNPSWDAAVGSWPRDEGLGRNIGSWVHGFLDRLAWKTPKGFRYTSFRAIRRPAADAMLAHETRQPVLGPLLLQSAGRVHNVPVEHRQREFGQSGFRFGHGIRTVLSNFFQGTTLPLRILSRFGLLASFFSLLLGVFLLGRWVLGYPTLPGWTSSLLAVVFFGGASLFGIGILGEYMHLMMREVRRPPRWAVRGRIGGAAAQAGDAAAEARIDMPRSGRQAGGSAP